MKRPILLVLLLLLVLAVTPGVMRSRAAWIVATRSPEIVSFTATPRVVAAGQPVTVAWETRGAPSVTMSWGPERHPRDNLQTRPALPPSGTMTDRPRVDTIYILECETPTGEMCMAASTTVRIK